MSSKSHIIILIFIQCANSLLSGQSIKISGRLIDKDEGKIISNGVVFLKPDNLVNTTGTKGEYMFTTVPGRKNITTQALGYKPANIRLEVFSDTTINIYIQVLPFELDEVTITGDSKKNLEITSHGSFILTPVALRETPRLFSEPDLLKSFQIIPGVIAGKDGISDIYVRGGGLGQNIVLANGCYFFLPGHLLGVISPYDLDFLESAELYKDYFPSEIGGGAASVINVDFKNIHSDSLKAQVRLGLLSSGFIIETPLKKIKWDLTAGLKRGNYSLYAPILKMLVAPDVDNFLPPNKYSFYDGFIKLSHSSSKYGNFNYLFFGNYDRGKDENKSKNHIGDTLTKYLEGVSNGWNNMVHAFQWVLPIKNNNRWKFNLNYNRLSMWRKIYMESEKFLNSTQNIGSSKTLFSLSPSINNGRR